MPAKTEEDKALEAGCVCFWVNVTAGRKTYRQLQMPSVDCPLPEHAELAQSAQQEPQGAVDGPV